MYIVLYMYVCMYVYNEIKEIYDLLFLKLDSNLIFISESDEMIHCIVSIIRFTSLI